jgi:hypothetical protein
MFREVWLTANELHRSACDQSSRKLRRLHVKRLVLCLTTMVLFAACETSADPLLGLIGGGGALTAAQATGNWLFTVHPNTTLPACSTPLADGQTITAHLDVQSDGAVASTSSWVNPITTAVNALGGSVDLTNGSSDLLFAASSGAQMELQGTINSSGGFTGGTLRDPEAGFSQVFGSGGCEYSVTGTKS